MLKRIKRNRLIDAADRELIPAIMRECLAEPGEFSRHDMTEPFVIEGFVYATDARIACRVPIDHFRGGEVDAGPLIGRMADVQWKGKLVPAGEPAGRLVPDAREVFGPIDAFAESPLALPETYFPFAPCDRCHGDGYWMRTCGLCHGMKTHLGSDCPACHGHGRIGRACPKCEGEGRLDLGAKDDPIAVGPTWLARQYLWLLREHGADVYPMKDDAHNQPLRWVAGPIEGRLMPCLRPDETRS